MDEKSRPGSGLGAAEGTADSLDVAETVVVADAGRSQNTLTGATSAPGLAPGDLSAGFPESEDPFGGLPELTDDADDPWAWASRTPEPDELDLSGYSVTAVLVSHRGAQWLPEVLDALDALTVRPARLIAIDNDSPDESAELLQAATERGVLDAVYPGDAHNGFGDAVRSALEQDQPEQDQQREPDQPGQDQHQGPDPQEPGDSGREHQGRQEWLWLLHDDARPAPDALANLLAHLASDPSIDVTGPKLLRPKLRGRPQQISEIGLTVTGTGRRELGLESGEIDQGQRDEPTERLAVSSCGMLVRRSVWDALSGFDPAVPGLRDGLEFGWRAQLSGHRVVTTPAAAMVHRQVGRAGLRPSGIAGRHPQKVDRELGLTLVAAHAGGPGALLLWLRLVVGGLLRSLGYLLGKAPGRSLDELRALGGFLVHPRRVRRMRARVRALGAGEQARERVERLRPPRWSSLRIGLEAIGAAVGNRYVAIAGEAEAATLDELTSDDMSTPVEDVRRNPWASQIVIVTVLSVVAALVAGRRLLGTGSLTSPFLLPSTDTLGAAWAAFLQPVPGLSDSAPTPWLGLVALASTVLAGQPEWLVRVLIIGVVPLSLITVYPITRATINGRRIRLWVALTYALLPPLLGGTNQGRLALSVVAILLPLLVIAARSLVLRRVGNPEAWRGGWGAGLVLTVLVAFQPVLIVLAVLLAVVGALTVCRQPRKIGRIAIAVGLPLAVWASWWPTVLQHWSRLLLGPDGALDGVRTPAPVWRFLLGHPGGAGSAPVWVGAAVFGLIWLIAVIGLVRSGRRKAVLAGWLVGLLSLFGALVLSRLVVNSYPDGVQVRPDVGVLMLLGFAALTLAGGIGVDGFSRELGSQSFSLLQPLAALVSVVAALVSLLGIGWWVVAGGHGPVTRTASDAIPPYVLNAQTSPSKVRTLAIDLSGRTAEYAVLEDDQIRLGDADRGFAFGGSDLAREQASSVVARLAAGTADSDIAPQLADLGINYIWVSGASADTASRISNTPGLAAASGNNRGTVWQLSQPTSRVRIVSGEQATNLDDRSPQTIPSSSLSRVLRLGEARDPRWQVTFNGAPLTPRTDDDWQASYDLPPSAGVLSYRLSAPISWYGLVSAALVLLAAVLAAPGIRRPEVRDPTRTARRVATAEDRR